MNEHILPDQLPNLRKDIEIQYGGYDKNNSPTWVISDPVLNKNYRIGWQDYEILSRWDYHLASKICDEINSKTTLNINKNHIKSVLDFLISHDLIDIDSSGSVDTLYYESIKKNAKNNFVKFINYFSYQIPLGNPDKFFTRLNIYSSFFTNKYIGFVCGLLFVSGIFLLLINSDRLFNSYNNLLSAKNLISFIVTFWLNTLIYSVGRGLVAKKFDLKVNSIGINIIFFIPFVYIETSPVNLITERHKRIKLILSGGFVQCLIGVIVMNFWGVYPEFFSSEFYVFWFTNMFLLQIFLYYNPLLNSDGTKAITDYLSTNFLNRRANKLAIWQIETSIFGLERTQPFVSEPQDKVIYIFFALYTWGYKFICFLVLTVFICYFISKILALVLFIGVLYYFIIHLIFKEIIISVFKLYRRSKISLRSVISLSVLSLVFFMLFVPWRSSIVIPAAVIYDNEYKVYSAYGSKILKTKIKPNLKVAQGELLVKLYAPELKYEIDKIEREINELDAVIKQTVSHEIDLEQKDVYVIELAEKQNDLNTLIKERENLSIKSPVAGQIISFNKSLVESSWVNKGEYLFTVANTQSKLIVGYLAQHELSILKQKATSVIGHFYTDNYKSTLIPIRVEKIESVVQKTLDNPYFASKYGGGLAVYTDYDKQEQFFDNEQELILKESVFKIIARPKSNESLLPEYSVRGKLILYSEPQSILSRMWNYFTTIVKNEAKI